MGFAYKPMPSREALHDFATQQIVSHLKETLAARGKASVLLSGGSTPGPVYENLSTVSIPWDKIDVGLVDERWVDETDFGSNAALIRNTLLKYQAKAARLTPMKSDHGSASSGQAEIEKSYADIVSINSLAVLGMGLDGHTASWFPEADGTETALNPNNKIPSKRLWQNRPQ